MKKFCCYISTKKIEDCLECETFQLGNYFVSANKIEWLPNHLIGIQFSGVIYDTQSLKNLFITKGYASHSLSYSELMLNAYSLWGEQCVSHINGSFSFVIFDAQNNLIFTAKDRLGKTMLYYYWKNGILALSNSLNLLIEYNFIDKSINKNEMAQYMRHGYIPTPYTIYENVNKLPMGGYIRFAKGDLKISQYWKPLERFHELNSKLFSSFAQAKEELENILYNAVKDRLVSDEPIGTFLSSGIDSSLITALAQKSSTSQINTYTIGIDDPNYNEANVAKEIARQIGTNHHEYYITEDDLLKSIEDIPNYYEEPYGDSSAIPCSTLARAISKDIKVALGGDGGDEIFGGYMHYPLLLKAQRYDAIGRIFDNLFPHSIKKIMPSHIRRVMGNNNPETKSQLASDEEIKKVLDALHDTYPEPLYPIETSMKIENWALRRQLLDIETTLVDDGNQKLLGASAASGLEYRSPLLDYRVVELSFRLPVSFKYGNSYTKHILKEIAYEYVPKRILDLPKKGFAIPMNKWLISCLKESFLDTINSDYVANQDIFDLKVIKEYYNKLCAGDKRYGDVCWYFYIFEKWWINTQRL